MAAVLPLQDRHKWPPMQETDFFSLGFVEFFDDFCCFLAEQIIQDRFLETLTRGMKEPLCLAGVCLEEV